MYKLIQLVICGLIGFYIGLRIGYITGVGYLYAIALVLAGVGGFIGYKFYKVTFYICANVIAFGVTFSFYWQKAMAIAKGSMDDLLTMKQIIASCIKNVNSLGKLSESVNQMFAMGEMNVGKVISQSANILRTGIAVSIVVALVAGLLALWIGDYVVMVITSALGAAILLSCASSFVAIPSNVYLIILIVISGIGLYSQLKSNKG